MSRLLNIAIVSDIHYAGPAERKRTGFLLEGVHHPLQRWAIHCYRHYIWLRDPFAHNALLDRFIHEARGADLVVANGDYSCDSAFIGVSDDAACSSADECLGKLRRTFGANFQANFGDHEIGKKMLGGDLGGPRLASFRRAERELGLKPFWTVTLGKYLLMGIASTLAAWPVYQPEALSEERADWEQERVNHWQAVRQAFAGLEPDQRVILFCHDPTALPFLWRETAVREKLSQVERTVIGHLHSELIFMKSRWLAGMPVIGFLGHTPKRLSAALHEARYWKPFNVLLCPSLSGLQISKGGGYYTAVLDPEGGEPVQFRRHPMRR